MAKSDNKKNDTPALERIEVYLERIHDAVNPLKRYPLQKGVTPPEDDKPFYREHGRLPWDPEYVE